MDDKDGIGTEAEDEGVNVGENADEAEEEDDREDRFACKLRRGMGAGSSSSLRCSENRDLNGEGLEGDAVVEATSDFSSVSNLTIGDTTVIGAELNEVADKEDKEDDKVGDCLC